MESLSLGCPIIPIQEIVLASKAAFKVHSKTVLPATFKRSLFLSAPIRLPLPAAAINKCKTDPPSLIIYSIYSTSKNNYFYWSSLKSFQKASGSIVS